MKKLHDIRIKKAISNDGEFLTLLIIVSDDSIVQCMTFKEGQPLKDMIKTFSTLKTKSEGI